MSKTVVLIVLDSLRYDVFRDYLRQESQSFLRRFADSALDFTGATAAAPWSLPSHASMFTGKYPREHGALRFDTRIQKELPTLVKQLNDREFVTGCFTSNEFIQSDYGFGEWDHRPDHYGYARFPDAHSPLSDETGIAKIEDALKQVARSGTPLKSLINAFYGQVRRSPALVDDGGKLMTRDATRWIEELSIDDDVFLFCNYMETHVFHKQLSSLRRRLWNVYNAGLLSDLQSKMRDKDLNPNGQVFSAEEIRLLKSIMTDELRYLDRHLQRLYNTLRKQGRTDDCLFLICSDHGEAFGEQGFVYHDFGGLTEPLVRVPLLVSAPNSSQVTVQKRVSLAWVYSTVLDFVDEHDGPNLTDPSRYAEYVATENTGHVLDVVDSAEAIHDYYLDDRLALYWSDTPTRKYVRVGDKCTVRRIEVDGLRETDVGSGGEEMFDRFDEQHASVAESKFDLNDNTKRRLRDLGYI